MPPKLGREAHDRLDDLVDVGGVEADRHGVDAAELLEQHRLALHHRQRGGRADVTEAEHRGAVGHDRDGVGDPGVARAPASGPRRSPCRPRRPRGCRRGRGRRDRRAATVRGDLHLAADGAGRRRGRRRRGAGWTGAALIWEDNFQAPGRRVGGRSNAFGAASVRNHGSGTRGDRGSASWHRLLHRSVMQAAQWDVRSSQPEVTREYAADAAAQPRGRGHSRARTTATTSSSATGPRCHESTPSLRVVALTHQPAVPARVSRRSTARLTASVPSGSRATTSAARRGADRGGDEQPVAGRQRREHRPPWTTRDPQAGHSFRLTAVASCSHCHRE